MTRNKRRQLSRRQRHGITTNTGGTLMIRRSIDVLRSKNVKLQRQQWSVTINQGSFD